MLGGEILQDHIPYEVQYDQKLPGIAPVQEGGWLDIDSAFHAQLALKEHLMETHTDLVYRLSERAEPAAAELLTCVVRELIQHHQATLDQDKVGLPNGHSAQINWDMPLRSLATLVQEDFCLLQKDGDEHVLTGGLLCFPASWSLKEKFMRPLTRIHKPVAEYDNNIEKRVQRLFNGIRADRPLWRYNALHYEKPDLFQPRTEADRRDLNAAKPYLRSERQVIRRLPKTEAIVFSIHTYVVRR